jgi:hypothetical protein
MLFNAFIVVIAIIIFIVFIITLFISIFTVLYHSSDKLNSSAQWAGLYFSQASLPGKGKFNLLLASIGVVSTNVANSSSQGDDTTVVELNDDDLCELLEPILSEIVGDVISAAHLHSLGLLTPTVIDLLEASGYIIN